MSWLSECRLPAVAQLLAVLLLVLAVAASGVSANPFVQPELQGGQRNDNTGFRHSRLV